jgi:DNA-binding transcriptional ArsR family regulator
MHKPPYKPFNYSLDWEATFKALRQLRDKIVHSRQKGEPHFICCTETMFAVYRDFMRKYKDGQTRDGRWCVTTTYLAQATSYSQRSISRHLNTLLDYGLLKGKILAQELFKGKSRMINCLRLEINPDYLLYKCREFNYLPVTFVEIVQLLSGELSTSASVQSVESVVSKLVSKYTKPMQT